MFFFVALLIALCSAEKQVIEEQQQSGGCSVCQLVVSYVESYVEQNQTEQYIEQQLDGLCSNLPLFQQECKNIVASELPSIIAWIKNEEPPQAFCASVGLCSNSSSVTTETEPEAGPIPCSICEIVGQFVEHWVSKNATESAIVQELDYFCTFTGPLRGQCDSFTAVYVPRLVAWVVAKEKPAVFCAQVGLCTAPQAEKQPFFQYRGKVSRGNPARLHVHKTPEVQVASSGCQICQVIVTYIEQLVAQKQTVTQIVKEVEQICVILPSSMRPVCNTFSARYVPQCVSWILKKENPQAFCAQVNLC
jgi:saposin